MGNAIYHSVEELRYSRQKSNKWFKSWKFITPISLIVLLLVSMSYYQATHFNQNRLINGIDVSGMTADKALEKLQSTILTNEVYLGAEQLIDGNDTKTEFTGEDLLGVKNVLKNQWTFFPSLQTKEYYLMPSNRDEYRSTILKTEIKNKLLTLNKGLTPPIDATAYIEDGKVYVSAGVDGKQYDVNQLLTQYEKHGYTSEIHLDPVYIHAITEDSDIVENEKKKLQELLNHTVDYKIQDQVYTFKGNELIKDATASKNLKVTITESDIEKKVAEINNAHSTLGKDFSFTTSSGGVITVKGQGYGWALNVKKETEQIQAAFEKGEPSVTVSESNIIGHGWKGEGYGYDTIENNGIGHTYAEVSIADQRIWLYREGKLVFSTNVVTGRHITGEDTSKGVWYILYKRSPYTLNGTSAGSGTYSIQVNYWAPFTNSGQGFHDASWRTNWSSNAYLTGGSGGCVNVKPNEMKTVYDNLDVYQPVVVY